MARLWTSMRRSGGMCVNSWLNCRAHGHGKVSRLRKPPLLCSRSNSRCWPNCASRLPMMSTPVIQLWEDVLALPLIGTLDSARTQVVMESLLQRIMDTGAAMAIIDITGVPMVDTLVAQHLLKTVSAARLMGADCVISGIRPQIAQTIVHLGVQLDVITKITLADALAVALKRLGMAIERAPGRT